MSSNSYRSGTSGQKSKRSLYNSNSYNGSSDSSSKKKSKNSRQKTLGMAWGSNSRSSSFRSSPFSDFGSYMVEKNRKLQCQFDAQASSSSYSALSPEKAIFSGVTIFVDGFTIPSSQELRSYMLKYGGRFANYFSRQSVTHIICSNLPDSKVKNLRLFSGGLPVVKPTWIVDSVVSSKLLSWVPYQLDQLANNQPKLSAFFQSKKSSVSEDGLTNAVCEVDPSLKGGTSEDTSVDEPIKGVVQFDGQYTEMKLEAEEPSSSTSSGQHSEVRTCQPSNSDMENEKRENSELHSCPNHNSKSSAIICPSNQCHSTSGDPNFVENYFKNSRLHFIGTWRNRYRKQFPSLINWFKCGGSTSVSDNSKETTIIHVDMDCFFVSVVIRNHPELHDKPVAVCHSDNPKGTAEISSANYPARDYGIKAGIFVRDAKALCPHLIIFPYNFQGYEEVADQFYKILHKHCSRVQAVSCDEAFLDITNSMIGDPELLASTIRKDIFETTGCTASAGIAGNMLMARLATRAAKPNGQCYIPPERVDEYLHQLPIKALPGIGYVLEDKLKKQNVLTCGQLRMISKDSLQKDFGMKTGEMLWNYSRGVDNRLVGLIQESKSVGAEVNWGVRFNTFHDSQNFLFDLCKEVSLRLQGCGVQGRKFTLKIKKRRKNAQEPTKYMGCGDCENLSHSITVPIATDDVEVIQRIAKQLFGFFHLDVKDIRGVGLQASKLENADTSKQALGRSTLRSWLTSTSAPTEQACNMNMPNEKADIESEVQIENGTSGQQVSGGTVFSAQMKCHVSSVEVHSKHVSDPPPLSHLDLGVIESLPPELFLELNEMYRGKLKDFIMKGRCKRQDISSSYLSSSDQVGVPTDGSIGTSVSDAALLNTQMVKNKENAMKEANLEPVSVAGCSNEATSSICTGTNDLMISSLGQVDTLTLQQLPEELQKNLQGLLPVHRRQDLIGDNALGSHSGNSQESSDMKATGKKLKPIDFDSNKDLWGGNPPQWVDKFKVKNSFILKALVEIYYKLGSAEKLSLILQRLTSCPLDESGDGWNDEAICCFCDLLKQYVRLNVELDVEEIYVCFRLIARLSTKFKFFLEVYNIVFPYLQAFVGEYYGGNLHISLNK